MILVLFWKTRHFKVSKFQWMWRLIVSILRTERSIVGFFVDRKKNSFIFRSLINLFNVFFSFTNFFLQIEFSSQNLKIKTKSLWAFIEFAMNVQHFVSLEFDLSSYNDGRFFLSIVCATILFIHRWSKSDLPFCSCRIEMLLFFTLFHSI